MMRGCRSGRDVGIGWVQCMREGTLCCELRICHLCEDAEVITAARGEKMVQNKMIGERK